MHDDRPTFRRPPAWVADQTPPSDYRVALRRLGAALRDAIALAVDTTAPPPEIKALAAEAERLRDRLLAAPRGRTHVGFDQARGGEGERAFLDTSPMIGLANPIAPPLRISIEGERVVGEVTFGDAYAGPPGHVHGGFIAAAFDDVLGATQSATGAPGMTGTLNVRYRKPTPLHRPVRIEGWLVRVEGRKILTAGTLHVDGVLCAEAEALFISTDFAALSKRVADARSGDGGGAAEKAAT